MPDGPFKYVLDYHDHGTKLCQLRPLAHKSQVAVAQELVNIFCIFGPPSILQVDNGREFSHAASKSRRVPIDEEVLLVMLRSFFLIHFFLVVVTPDDSSAMQLLLRSKHCGLEQY